jgi:protein ImuB
VRLVHVDPAGRALGLKPGATLADARAMFPLLAVAEADLAADAATLAAIADWARRWTPLVALEGGDGLVMDVTGVDHLFGGEQALMDDVRARLGGQGFNLRLAVAGTAPAAAAMARFGAEIAIPRGEEAIHVEPLPVAALLLDRDRTDGLTVAGLRRIGDVALRPRAPLAARFGKALLDRLDAVLGRSRPPLTPRLEMPAYMSERRFAEPVGRIEDVEQATSRLCRTLAQQLEHHGEGANRLSLDLFRSDGALHTAMVGVSRPTRDAAMMLRLLRERMNSLGDALDPGFGYDVIRLSALEVRPLAAHMRDFGTVSEADITPLVDQLGARLGRDRIERLLPRDSHWPERASASVSAARSVAMPLLLWPTSARSLPAERPIRLFDPPDPIEVMAAVPDGPPLRFRWRRVLHHVVKAEGPERIGAEWWREDAFSRDYFRVESSSGHRLWLYREGLYGRETAAPRWFLHGVFA